MPSNPKPPPRIKLTPKKYKELCSQVWGKYRGICQICHRDTMIPQYHHTTFRSQGGSDTIENIILLCFECHKEIHGGKDAQKLRELAVKIKKEEIDAKQM